MRRIAVAIAVLACAGFGTCAGGTAKAGSNLLFNPGFDDDLQLDGWTNTTPSDLEFAWEPGMDRSGFVDSGAVRLTNDSASANFFGRVTQCIPITPGAEVEWGGWLYVESGQGVPITDASFGIRATFYSGSDCTGQASPFGILNWTVTDQWHFRSLASVVQGAESLRAELVLRKAAAGGSFTGFMDDIQVVPEPRLGVLNGAALLALVALAVIPRLRASRPREPTPRADRAD